ncbi:MAG TPA: 8-amino-7-oxononanoate synthase [Terriglobia bacterium]|nr:8-amino-7-oxononanoate synthase [Terriglobia bacterium]
MPGTAGFEDRVRRRILELEEAGLRRVLQPPRGIDFSSNDYLSLANHPRLKQAMAEAVLAEGCGSTASRLLRGDRPIVSAVERRFAAFKGMEASLYFSSGYTANLSVLSTLVERHDIVFTDSQNHASVVDGIRLSRAKRVKFRHCDVDDLARRMRAPLEGSQRFLVTESLFSMDGDFAPLADYAQLCRETETILIVDEAHAVGIYGERGSGWVEQTGCGKDVFLSVDTAGKSLGVSGAFVSGPSWAVDYLIQRSRPFMFSTAPAPALAAALDAAISIIEEEPERRQRVQDLSTRLRRTLNSCGIDTGRSESQIIPVILGDNDRARAVASELQQEGFDIRAIRPPAVPAGTARLRISVNAGLSEAIIDRFADAVQRVTSCSAVSS